MISPVNQLYINEHPNIDQGRCDIVPYYEVTEAELDEMWSYVFSEISIDSTIVRAHQASAGAKKGRIIPK